MIIGQGSTQLRDRRFQEPADQALGHPLAGAHRHVAVQLLPDLAREISAVAASSIKLLIATATLPPQPDRKVVERDSDVVADA